jgi:hypothetical protein
MVKDQQDARRPWRLFGKMILIISVFTVLLSGAAKSQNIQTLGPGADASCGEWLANRQAGNEALLQSWALGYLSAAAITSYAFTRARPLNGIDANAVFYWLDNYCRAHPTTSFVAALSEFSGERSKETRQ